MSPHQDGQLPPMTPRDVIAERIEGKSVIFDAACPGCGNMIEWYGDAHLQKTVPGACRTCTSRLPGVVRLREVAERLSRGLS